MGAEREPQGPRSEFNRLTSLTSFIGERFLYIKQGIHNIREFTSQRWQDISRFNKADMGRAIAITSTFIASLTGAPFAKADTLRDGGGTGELTKVSDRYKLGFRALAEQIPTIAGEPLEDERYGSNGDSLQQTTKGLMVWRKGDNWTAFTDGVDTYINGPQGLAVRPNDQRFKWEESEVAGVQATPTIPQELRPTPTPEVTPVPALKLKNLFQDPFGRVTRRQFTPDQIAIMGGIELRGPELINNYAKSVFDIIKKVPEYDALIKRYVRSLEVYTLTDGKGKYINTCLALNDTFGDAGNFVSASFDTPGNFVFSDTAADLIFETKLTEFAVNGNPSGRYEMPLVADPQLQKEQQILWNQARKGSAEAAADFARKAGLPQAIIAYWQNSAKTAEENLAKLLAGK